jgi:hypothetical protein
LDSLAYAELQESPWTALSMPSFRKAKPTSDRAKASENIVFQKPFRNG